MANPNSGFPDHFSSQAKGYAEFRPHYPAALADFLAGLAPTLDLALEFGCGSGLFTILLAERFARVIAVDASAELVATAPRLENVDYRIGRAEDGIAEPAIADAIFVAQAAHWFDLPRFHESAARAAKPRAILALLSYGRIELADPRADELLRRFYDRDLAGCWPSERAHVEDGYRSLDFPLAELDAPAFHLEASWTVDALLGYVDTWSAVRQLEREGGRGLFDAFAARLREVAPPVLSSRFPIAIRVGRYPDGT